MNDFEHHSLHFNCLKYLILWYKMTTFVSASCARVLLLNFGYTVQCINFSIVSREYMYYGTCIMMCNFWADIFYLSCHFNVIFILWSIYFEMNCVSMVHRSLLTLCSIPDFCFKILWVNIQKCVDYMLRFELNTPVKVCLTRHCIYIYV